jgi:hypothetical protein
MQIMILKLSEAALSVERHGMIRDPDLHRHSLERVFPKLGETATSAEIIGFLDRRPGQP